MKLCNLQLLKYNEILGEYATKRLPQRISYAIMKNIQAVSTEMAIYQDMLKQIVSSYEEFFIKDEGGNPQMFPSGIPIVDEAHMAEYMQQIDELLNQEIKVQFYTIDEDLFFYDNTERYDVLSAADIMKLTEILCPEEGSED